MFKTKLLNVFRGVLIFLLLLVLSNCSKDQDDYKNIDGLMDQIKKEKKHSNYPRLIVDGYDVNYSFLRGKLDIDKEDIGHFTFVENNENGELHVVLNLPKIQKSEFEKYYIELNEVKINYAEFNNISLNNITKKVVLPAEKINDPKYNDYEKVILIFTD